MCKMYFPESLSKFWGILQSDKRYLYLTMSSLASRGELLESLLTFLLSGFDQQQNDLGLIPKIRQERGQGKRWREPLGYHRGFFFCLFVFFKDPGKCSELTRDAVKSGVRIPKGCVCFAAKFTEFPRNVTATEGQNVEMSCAFQSGSASVYLEIQWWFLRGPEDLEPGADVAGAQVAELRRPNCLLRVRPTH